MDMKKPLENVRVLDLSRYMAGPFCGKILADLGAEVIKIEAPWGEESRFRPPLTRGLSATFMEFHRGKKGMTINLKKEKGVKIFKELVKHADVVLENYRAGTMDRLGIGYETLKEINPKIILASITGFGQYGPRAKRPSFDILGQATSGFMAVMGQSIDPEGPPILVPEAPGDSIPGTYCALSIIAALYWRQFTGRGQRIDIAQQDVMMYITPSIAMYLLTGMTGPDLRRKIGTDIPGVYGSFKAKDGYVALAAPMGPVLDRLVKAFGRDSVDRGFIEEWVRSCTVDQVVSKLVEADVPVSPIFTVPEVIEDQHASVREMIVEVEHPQAGKVKVVGIPMKFSETPCRVEGPSPLLGQHNEEILTSLLGYSKEEVVELKKEGVI
ncbi:MAG: CaiB/BaiF CoA transferase family protein [Candidatus Bathyarchaeia archaeon]